MTASDAAQFDLFMGLMVGGGVVWFTSAFNALQEKLLLQNTPESPIRSLAMGLARVSGRVVATEPLTAPLSGAACVYYTLCIVRDPGSKQSVTLVDEQHRLPFILDDGTGRALVDPDGAEFVEPTVTCSYSGSASGMPDAAHAYFSAHGIAEKNMLFTQNFSVYERVCPVGQTLFVLGSAQPPDPGDEQQAACRAVFKRDKNAPAFLVCAEGQKQFLRDLETKVWYGLIGGPLITLGGLAWFLIG